MGPLSSEELKLGLQKAQADLTQLCHEPCLEQEAGEEPSRDPSRGKYCPSLRCSQQQGTIYTGHWVWEGSGVCG